MTEVSVIREVAPSAHVSPEATIGPYCVVGPKVTIGPHTVLRRRVSVTGSTTIGSHNVFEDGCVIGWDPQDLKFRGEQTLLLIGHHNHFGRQVTIHVGTEMGGYLTRIGDGNVLRDGCHVAHDCYVDDRTRLGCNVQLAGHIRVETGAVIEDLAGAHHFTTVGRFARVGPRTPIRRDVPPYSDFYSDAYDWDPPSVRGLHEAGLASAELSRAEEGELRQAMSDLFADESALQTKIEQLVNMGVEGEVAALCQFCQRSLQGVYGRYRERFRGKFPPEAFAYLPPEIVKGKRTALR